MYVPLSLLVGHIERPDVLSLVGSDDADVHVTARALEIRQTHTRYQDERAEVGLHLVLGPTKSLNIPAAMASLTNCTASFSYGKNHRENVCVGARN